MEIKKMDAEFLDYCHGEWPYLLSIREYIGVFEYPKSFLEAAQDLDEAKAMQKFWKDEIGNGVSIFKISVWPERRRK